MPERATGCLPRQEIERLAADAGLIIGFDPAQLQASSYDLRIGTIFRRGQVIDADHPEAHSQVILDPGELISLFTEEELTLPPDILATVFPINKQSSRGLLVLNPGHVDPGFSGPLSLRVLNLRRTPLAISRGMPVFTVVFERLSEATNRPYPPVNPRRERERDFNQADVETSPNSLSQLVQLGRDAPYPNRAEVREMIVGHWMSWATLGLAALAAIAAIGSVILTVNGARPREVQDAASPVSSTSIHVQVPPPLAPDTTTRKQE